MLQQRICGAFLILLSCAVIVLAAQGGTVEDRDITGAFLPFIIGIAAVCTKQQIIYTNIKEDVDPMEIGTKVVMVDCAEAEKYEGQVWTTRSEPWDVCGTQVVLLEGKSGVFAVDKLKVVSD